MHIHKNNQTHTHKHTHTNTIYTYIIHAHIHIHTTESCTDWQLVCDSESESLSEQITLSYTRLPKLCVISVQGCARA